MPTKNDYRMQLFINVYSAGAAAGKSPEARKEMGKSALRDFDDVFANVTENNTDVNFDIEAPITYRPKP